MPRNGKNLKKYNYINMKDSFEILDLLTGNKLSQVENDPALYKQRVRWYKNLLNMILNKEVLKTDTPDEIFEKVENVVIKIKLKPSLQWDKDQLRTLNSLIKENKWLFASYKQRAFFKGNLIRNWVSYDSLNNWFMLPMIDFMLPSDIWAIYETYRFWDNNRNWGHRIYILDDKWVRKVLNLKNYIKIVKEDRMAGFSKDNYKFTRARKNEMNAWLKEPQEKHSSIDGVEFERK